MPPTQPDDRYLACMGLAPKRIPHWEHWSCPSDETFWVAWARLGCHQLGS